MKLNNELIYYILSFVDTHKRDYSFCFEENNYLKRNIQREQTIDLIRCIFGPLFFIETSFTKEEIETSSIQELKEKIRAIFDLLYPSFVPKHHNFYNLSILINYFSYFDSYDYILQQKQKKNSRFYMKNRYTNGRGIYSRNVYCLIDAMND